jgi:hypothetical protein
VIGSNQSPGDAVVSPPADPPLAPSPGVEPGVVEAAPPAPVTARRPNPVRRFFEWFWLGRAMAELRARGRVGSPRALELLRRAWRSVELAERALSPTPRLVHGAADAEARELARQGLFWALAAEATLRREASQPNAHEASAPFVGVTLLELWHEAERSLLVSAAGGEPGVHLLEVSLRVNDFADFAELSAEEQARKARDLVAFVRTLIGLLEAPRVSLDRLWTRRVLRVGLGFAVLVGSVMLALSLSSRQENARDWARDRPYKTSSVYPNVGCKSPEQDCPESPFYFFHTQEEDHAWIEIDLGTKRRFSAIKVVNRTDCCADRAAPLAFEISSDHTKWHEVARRNEVFNTWTQEFAPQSARWVRLVLLKKSALHLHRFSVLR